MSDKLKILPAIDKSDSYRVKKDILADLPMRLAIIGKSDLSGKTTILLNLFRDEFYGKDFKGGDIYIVSPSAHSDTKLKNLIKFKKIPDENVMTDYDEEKLTALYEYLRELYNEDVINNRKPKQKIVIGLGLWV